VARPSRQLSRDRALAVQGIGSYAAPARSAATGFVFLSRRYQTAGARIDSVRPSWSQWRPSSPTSAAGSGERTAVRASGGSAGCRRPCRRAWQRVGRGGKPLGTSHRRNSGSVARRPSREGALFNDGAQGLCQRFACLSEWFAAAPFAWSPQHTRRRLRTARRWAMQAYSWTSFDRESYCGPTSSSKTRGRQLGRPLCVGRQP
jgi:hypothetical protein